MESRGLDHAIANIRKSGVSLDHLGDAKHQWIVASYRMKMDHLDIFSMQPRGLTAHTLRILPPAHHRIKTTDDGWPTRGRDSRCLISVNSVAPVPRKSTGDVTNGRRVRLAKIKDITNSKLPTSRVPCDKYPVIPTIAENNYHLRGWIARNRSVSPLLRSHTFARFSDACLPSGYFYSRNPCCARFAQAFY